jgi:AAA domain
MNSVQAAIPPKFENIPTELKSQNRWVTWRYEKKGTSEKALKMPHAPHGEQRNASSTNPATWGTFEQAQSAYMSGGMSGIGFVLNNDGLVGVDLDHCVHDGVADPAALALLDGLGATYVEISPSGNGLRAIGYGERLDSGVNGSLNGLKGEFYSTRRYLTITGNTLKSGSLSKLMGFKAISESFNQTKTTKVNQETGRIENVTTGEKQAALMQQISSGEVYHDSLRDLAASFVANGMPPESVITVLNSLMDNAVAIHDGRWKDRREQIPDLVNSAYAKFVVGDFSDTLEQAAPNNQRYKLIGTNDLRNLPPLMWRVRGVLPAVGMAALYGPSASGKSFLALDMAAAIAGGWLWFGCRVVAAPVVYVVLEGEAGFKLRVAAWEDHEKRSIPDGLHLVLQSFTLTQPQDLVDLAAVVPVGAVVFIDTLNRAAPTADENSSKDMGQILEAAKALQSRTNGLVVLVHHTGKDTSKGLRGHSSLFAAMDAAVEVSRAGDRRDWKVAKSKDGQDGCEHSFNLEIISLGDDEYGDSITSCVVIPTEQPASHTKPLTPSQRLAFDTLAAQDDLFGTGIHRDVWRDAFYPLCNVEKQEAKRKAFNRALNELIVQGRVSAVNDMFSIPDF